MRNYAGMCQGICSHKLVCDFLLQLLSFQSSVFVVHFSNAFWHGNNAFPKVVLGMKLFLSLQSFTCHIVNIGVSKYVFTFVVIRTKNFSLVSHSRRSCSTRVAVVSLVSGIRVVNWTRSTSFFPLIIVRRVVIG